MEYLAERHMLRIAGKSEPAAQFLWFEDFANGTGGESVRPREEFEDVGHTLSPVMFF